MPEAVKPVPAAGFVDPQGEKPQHAPGGAGAAGRGDLRESKERRIRKETSFCSSFWREEVSDVDVVEDDVALGSLG